MPFAAMLPIWQFTPILFMTTPSHECSMPENATNDYFFRPEDADERKCFIIYKNVRSIQLAQLLPFKLYIPFIRTLWTIPQGFPAHLDGITTRKEHSTL